MNWKRSKENNMTNLVPSEDRFESFIEQLKAWCVSNADVLAIALVGSHARGTARADSDIDLVIICTNETMYTANANWIKVFDKLQSATLEDWGLVQSWRVHFQNGLEVEFGITTEAWCAPSQIENGTGRVISDGVRIIYDPKKLLAKLIDCIRNRLTPGGGKNQIELE
jgi:predicted nucleotidyltransferase